ncbi:MAG: VanZ family protein [Candidatus Eiseniibacteriota bacterium]|nr:MAG: VanZ family protein [Candidatus Eisenbacteria bacterium]
MKEMEEGDVKFLSAFLRLWLPVLGYVTLIFALSSTSGLPGTKLFPHMDKAAHFVEYAILGFLVGRAFRHSGVYFITRFWLGLAIVAALAVGFVDEWYQATVPGRERSALDFLADAAGAAFGQIALLITEKRWERRKRAGSNR